MLVGDLRSTNAWAVARANLPVFLGVLAVTALAKAAALLPGYALDDWPSATEGPGVYLQQDVLSKGRVGHWLFLKLAVALNLEPNPARIFHVSLAIVAYAAFGLAVVRFWRLQDRGWLAVATASIVANHPYTCEIFTFRIGLPPAAIVIAILSVVLWLATGARPHLIIGSLAFAFAISFYQIAIHFGLMVVLLGFAIGLARHPALHPGAEGGAPREIFDRRSLRLLLMILLGGVWYWLAGVVIGKAIGLRADFFTLLPLQRMPGRLLEVGKAVARTFWPTNVLIPRVINLALVLLVGVLIIVLAWRALRSGQRIGAAALGLAIGGVLVGALLWSAGLFLILERLWLTPRSMAHIGVFWAGVAVLLAQLAPGRAMWAALCCVTGVIALAFVGSNQSILDEQWRINLRDLHKANRIVARLEESPEIHQVRRVVFVGGHAWYPMGLNRTQWGDMNISAFAAEWSKVPLLREVSGYPLRWSTDPAEKAAAAEYCAGVEPWPSPDSVEVRGELAFICLVRTPRPASEPAQP